VFDLAAKRQLNRGYSDGLSRALEIVVTPLLFGFVGHLVDGWLGTGPAFMIGLGAFAVTGLFVRFWLGYDREMRAHEAKLPRSGAAGSSSAASAASADEVEAADEADAAASAVDEVDVPVAVAAGAPPTDEDGSS
jgi:hypothetical protein